MPFISIIIIDYNNLEYTKRCLESLAATTYPYKEIIVVDNGSGSETRKFYYEQQAKGKIIFFDFYSNRGLAEASNQGAKFARGDWFFFLNNDTLIKPDIFEQLLQGTADVRGCRMFNYDGSKELDSALSVDRFGCPVGKQNLFFYPDGAIFIKKSVFNEIGGFDENLFLYGEDRDLCWRVWLAGYNIEYCPLAVFFHNSTCVDDTTYHRRYISEKNIIRSMLKNYQWETLLIRLPQYVFWTLLELGLVLFTNPKAIWKSYLPAYWWNIKNFKDTIRARNNIIRRIKDKNLPMSKKIGKLFVLETTGIPKWR